MNPLPESSSPPVDARVACVDGGASPTTNKACPAGFDKLDDHGRGGFPPNIEAEWIRYIKWQEQRLADAGERHPSAWLLSDGTGYAASLLTPSGEETRAATLHEAVTKRLELMKQHGPDLRKKEKIAKLEKELASLKGEGAGE